jgi:SOS-response transcriptional repressor LexA
LREPNAEIVLGSIFATGDRRVADRPERIKTPFGVDAQLTFRALGVSMVGEGILPDDTVYGVVDDSANATADGKLVACRIGEDIFVKRLIVRGTSRYLMSANARYRVIAVDEEGLSFEILGVIIGRSGRIGS